MSVNHLYLLLIIFTSGLSDSARALGAIPIFV